VRKFHKLAAVNGAVFAAATVVAVMAQAVPANAAPAHAQAASSAAVRVVKVTVPMKIVGFDAAVAKAHGYVIRTDAQGRQYSVKAGAAAIPGNRVYGNCGDSWLYEIAVGNHAVDIRTGFDVNTPAVAFYWKYWMHDRGGTSSHDDGGGLAFRNTWEADDRWGALTPGPANAWVDSGSDAILDDGSVCVTAGPADSTTIY
jgi:hypothetical protein